MAGKAWYYAFMKRHKNLSLRLPEKVSMARAAGFNEQNVNHFFDLLEKLVDKEGFNALTVYNVDESAREHGVVLLQLPGHTTNRLQPLDVSLFKPMENYFIKAVERFLHTNPGVPVSQYNMTPLLNEAYANAASIATIENGFRRAGIWPVDRAVFSQADFVPAALLLETTPPLVSQVQMEVGLNVSIEEILPLPENRPTLKRRKRCQPAVVLSSTPYKNDLHKKQTETSSKNNKKSQACSMKRNLSTVLSESTSLTSSNLGNIQTSVDIEVDPADWYCFMCEDNMIEDMVQCMKCKSWAHSKCAGKGKKLKKYICVNWA
nr:unnamed protein product [Callosobruchus analis]